MLPRGRRPSRGSVASVCGLLVVGSLALGSATVTSESIVPAVSPVGLLTDGLPIDTPALAVSGGLLVIGLTAVSLALALLFARVT